MFPRARQNLRIFSHQKISWKRRRCIKIRIGPNILKSFRKDFQLLTYILYCAPWFYFNVLAAAFLYSNRSTTRIARVFPSNITYIHTKNDALFVSCYVEAFVRLIKLVFKSFIVVLSGLILMDVYLALAVLGERGGIKSLKLCLDTEFMYCPKSE